MPGVTERSGWDWNGPFLPIALTLFIILSAIPLVYVIWVVIAFLIRLCENGDSHAASNKGYCNTSTTPYWSSSERSPLAGNQSGAKTRPPMTPWPRPTNGPGSATPVWSTPTYSACSSSNAAPSHPQLPSQHSHNDFPFPSPPPSYASDSDTASIRSDATITTALPSYRSIGSAPPWYSPAASSYSVQGGSQGGR